MGLANLTNLVQSNHVSFRWQSIANTFPVPGIQILYRTAEILPACPKSKSIKISITSLPHQNQVQNMYIGFKIVQDCFAFLDLFQLPTFLQGE